jgi:hypothetical protein
MSGAVTFGLGAKSATYWGITWGVVVGIVEYLAVAPLDDWGSLQQLIFWLLYWLMPFWCVVGCLFVWLADRQERSAHRARFAALFTLTCVLSAALQPLLSIGLIRLMIDAVPGFARYVATAQETQPRWSNSVPDWSNWSTLALYQIWETLFYGGLLVAARLFTVRMERTRHLLHHSAMARSRAEALLDSARLEALQSQIDPKLLLDSMQDLEQRYRASPDGAERLLEALVEFLRYAMHGLRVPVSTLDAELQLAHAFSTLQHERGVEGAWRIVEEAAPPNVPRKFPSLLMLRLLALGGDGGRPMLRVRQENGQTVLSLHGVSRSVSGELQQQIRTRLYALYGERFLLESHPLSLHQLRITLMSTSPGESNA